MHTIKSVSDEGTYYLCNHWNKFKTFWLDADELKETNVFKTPGLAKRSLKHLLEIMPDYTSDEFSLVDVTFRENGSVVISEAKGIAV